jgi:hypothetical protein
MIVNIEVTDTFNGEANYSWVRRHTLDMMDTLSNYSVVRRAKAAVGWNGKRCTTVNYGDMIELRPYGVCQVCFITFGE